MVAKVNAATTQTSPSEVKAITAALATPFEAGEVKFKPQAVKNNRALALAYVDARVIQDRLDEVLGVEGWQDEYQLLPDGSVVCKLTLKLGDQWITKMDVGSPSEQPDSGDRLKAAFSDALKRAAVKFGVGRYLYRLQSQWADYDPVKKQFSRPPHRRDYQPTAWSCTAGSARTTQSWRHGSYVLSGHFCRTSRERGPKRATVRT
jgi:hypothetical protein